MCNPKSLTISSLINIVGEDKLYATLESKLYLYVSVYEDTDPDIFMFRTDANPIKWLLFNNVSFMWLMLYAAYNKESTRNL